MKRTIVLASIVLSTAVGCSDGDLPPEDCEPPLPATNDDGDPWPTYAEANAALERCEDDASIRRRGTCADGKLFIETLGNFAGDTQYFVGETLVGLRRFSDVVFSCSEYRFGDARCEPTDSNEVVCP